MSGATELHGSWKGQGELTPPSTAAERGNLLKKELEQLVVEAKRLGLDREDVNEAIEAHWHRLDGANRATRRKP